MINVIIIIYNKYSNGYLIIYIYTQILELSTIHLLILQTLVAKNSSIGSHLLITFWSLENLHTVVRNQKVIANKWGKKCFIPHKWSGFHPCSHKACLCFPHCSWKRKNAVQKFGVGSALVDQHQLISLHHEGTHWCCLTI